MDLALHFSNTFWICWIILIKFEGWVDVLEISKALGGETKWVLLLRERQVEISNYMNFHCNCFILAFVQVTESCFTDGCKDHMRTAGFLGRRDVSSQGRREGTTGDLNPVPAGNQVLMFCISLPEERFASGFQSALEEDTMIHLVRSMDSTVWFHWWPKTAELISSSGLMLWCPALSPWMLITWRLNSCHTKEDPHKIKDLLVHIKCRYGKITTASVLTKLNNPQISKQL